MIGHVGTRVSALIDGQLPAAEAERLWAHVHSCSLCRCQVEREGWIKTQLAGFALTTAQPSTPDSLKGMLSGVGSAWCGPAGLNDPLAAPLGAHHERKRVVAAVAVGAGSIGAAMAGVIALSVPAEAPGIDRRPTTSLTPVSTPPTVSVRRSTGPIGQPWVGSLLKWVTITP